MMNPFKDNSLENSQRIFSEGLKAFNQATFHRKRSAQSQNPTKSKDRITPYQT